MSSLSFDLPVWAASIYHSERGADNPWNRVFNVPEAEGAKENKKEALKIAVGLFEADGLSAVTIYSIEIAPLKFLEGGEDG